MLRGGAPTPPFLTPPFNNPLLQSPLQATPKDGKVILTWGPPDNGGCVSTYVVNVEDPYLRTSGAVQVRHAYGQGPAAMRLSTA